MRDAAEAEDAAQQVFLSAYRALLGGADVREPAAWLATIARNECAARVRRRMREPLALDGDAAANGDPVAEAIRRADLRALWVAISALPPQQRDALLLREFAGMSYAELAQALSVSEPAVESLLSRARTRLRERVGSTFASVFGGIGWAGGAAKLTATAVTVAVVAGGADVAPRVVHRDLPRTSVHAKRVKPAAKPVIAVSKPVAPGRPARVVHPRPVAAERERRSGRERESTARETEPVVTIGTTSGGNAGDSSDDSASSSDSDD